MRDSAFCTKIKPAELQINDTLRRVIETGHLEADLRRVIREELHPE